jgi:hypothetical protein
VKKLLAMLLVAGLIGFTTGCPAEPSGKPSTGTGSKGTKEVAKDGSC